MEKAHDLSHQRRTLDVFTDGDIKFSDMLLSDSTLKGLEASGFKQPSPIQKKAIPFGRCGFDLIVQAKSGTGKTCVFTVIALEMLVPDIEKVQVIVLAPTREICVQIANVISSISHCMGNIKAEAFIGGLPLEQDKKKVTKCQIAVGAPGRMKHLISNGIMNVDAVRLFVLDEADRLMEENFREDIRYIYSKLPHNKQMIAASATFPKELEKFVSEFMKKPIKVSPGEDTILLGVRQFVSLIPSHPTVLVQMKNKTAELIKILSSVPFKQCLVFSNFQGRAESTCDELTKEGWPAIYINGSQTQVNRLKAFNSLKEYRCRVLLSTDLTSRGIDAENVNLIINLDLPYDGATYLHRIGRAGRYGTYGIAITIVQEDEVERFRNLLYEVGGENFHVLVFPNKKFAFDIWEASEDNFEKMSSLFGVYKFIPKKELDKAEDTNIKHQMNNSTEEEAISVIHHNRLNLPKKPCLKTFETLVNDLASFQIDDTQNQRDETEILERAEDPVKYESNLICLENASWNSFHIKLNSFKNKNKINGGICEVDNDCKPNLNNSETSVSYGCNESSEDISEVDYDESSDSDNEISDDTETTAEDESEVFYSDNIQNWYSMWIHQSRAIRNYVQYCHYCKEMFTFS